MLKSAFAVVSGSAIAFSSTFAMAEPHQWPKVVSVGIGAIGTGIAVISVLRQRHDRAIKNLTPFLGKEPIDLRKLPTRTMNNILDLWNHLVDEALKQQPDDDLTTAAHRAANACRAWVNCPGKKRISKKELRTLLERQIYLNIIDEMKAAPGFSGETA